MRSVGNIFSLITGKVLGALCYLMKLSDSNVPGRSEVGDPEVWENQ